MENYDKLVAALRYHADTTNCDACKLYDAGKCELKSCVLHDAAAAIEELQDKVVELEEELNDADIAADDNGWQVEELQAEVERLQAQMPKRGEWIRVEDGESYHYECSECGERPLYSRFGDIVFSGVCPICGAKMEVQ